MNRYFVECHQSCYFPQSSPQNSANGDPVNKINILDKKPDDHWSSMAHLNSKAIINKKHLEMHQHEMLYQQSSI